MSKQSFHTKILYNKSVQAMYTVQDKYLHTYQWERGEGAGRHTRCRLLCQSRFSFLVPVTPSADSCDFSKRRPVLYAYSQSVLYWKFSGGSQDGEKILSILWTKAVRLLFGDERMGDHLFGEYPESAARGLESRLLSHVIFIFRASWEFSSISEARSYTRILDTKKNTIPVNIGKLKK